MISLKISKVIEAEDEHDANSYIGIGWMLLHVGTRTEGQDSSIIYVLGWPELCGEPADLPDVPL